MNNANHTWTLSQVAQAVNGERFGDDVHFSGVSTDSRSIGAGELFVALVGPNFNGNEFVSHAASRGAAAVVVSEQVNTPLPGVVVNDTRIALGLLASAWRDQFSYPVIAITGSNGKTTVKEMMASIMRCEKNTLATRGNLNNDFGVPLTLLRMTAAHEAAIIEMGANHHGEIKYLTEMAKPNVALITNAGPAHLEGFGDLKGVSRAKGEIYSGLSSSGTAIINADDQFADYWRSLNTDRKVLTFGLKQPADVTASYETTLLTTKLSMRTPAGTVSVDLPMPGEHSVLNALAATAACIAAGASLDSVKAGLENLQKVSGRFQVRKGKAGSRIIDDTYNANPASLKAALDVLRNMPGHHFLAIGDMGELGNNAEQMHRDAGRQAKDSGVNRLYAIGKYARFITQSFGKDAEEFNDHVSMISAINDELNPDVTLLVKGSRLMHMEKVVDALVANGENQ